MDWQKIKVEKAFFIFMSFYAEMNFWDPNKWKSYKIGLKFFPPQNEPISKDLEFYADTKNANLP
jgi:hypothetical protein